MRTAIAFILLGLGIGLISGVLLRTYFPFKGHRLSQKKVTLPKQSDEMDYLLSNQWMVKHMESARRGDGFTFTYVILEKEVEDE